MWKFNANWSIWDERIGRGLLFNDEQEMNSCFTHHIQMWKLTDVHFWTVIKVVSLFTMRGQFLHSHRKWPHLYHSLLPHLVEGCWLVKRRKYLNTRNLSSTKVQPDKCHFFRVFGHESDRCRKCHNIKLKHNAEASVCRQGLCFAVQ